MIARADIHVPARRTEPVIVPLLGEGGTDVEAQIVWLDAAQRWSLSDSDDDPDSLLFRVLAMTICDSAGASLMTEKEWRAWSTVANDGQCIRMITAAMRGAGLRASPEKK